MKKKLIYILADLRVNTLSAHVHFWVNYSIKQHLKIFEWHWALLMTKLKNAHVYCVGMLHTILNLEGNRAVPDCPLCESAQP